MKILTDERYKELLKEQYEMGRERGHHERDHESAEVERLTEVIGILQSKLQMIDGCTSAIPNALVREAIKYAREEIR